MITVFKSAMITDFKSAWLWLNFKSDKTVVRIIKKSKYALSQVKHHSLQLNCHLNKFFYRRRYFKHEIFISMKRKNSVNEDYSYIQSIRTNGRQYFGTKSRVSYLNRVHFYWLYTCVMTECSSYRTWQIWRW